MESNLCKSSNLDSSPDIFDRNNPDNWAKPGYNKLNKFGLNQKQFDALSEHMLNIAFDSYYTNGVLIELAKSLNFEYLDYYDRED